MKGQVKTLKIQVQIQMLHLRPYIFKCFHSEGGKAPEHVAQSGCGCLIPGVVQGQVGWGSEQCYLVVDFAANGSGVGTE